MHPKYVEATVKTLKIFSIASTILTILTLILPSLHRIDLETPRLMLLMMELSTKQTARNEEEMKKQEECGVTKQCLIY